MEYELYHDESQEGGYWHGMLLVPVARKKQLLELLAAARENCRYNKPVGIKKVKRSGKKSDCVEAFIHIGISSLISRRDRIRNQVYLGKKEAGRRVLEILDVFIGAKFILFREVDAHMKMDGHQDHGSKVETTARMGLKGGLHLLGESASPIRVVKLHFDGHEHHRRSIDGDRIIGRMNGLREYCSINEEIDDRPGNHEVASCQEYDDCQLLQLADTLIGAFRSGLGVCTNGHQRRFAEIVRPLVSRFNQGPARMRNSRWRNGFSLSQCQLEDGVWRFSEIPVARTEDRQASLF